MLYKVNIKTEEYAFRKIVHSESIESVWKYVLTQIEKNGLNTTNIKVSIEKEETYDKYVILIDKGYSKKEIQSRLGLSFRQLNNYNQYYLATGVELTLSKYITLVEQGFSDEEIRKLYKIPIEEFDFFKQKMKQ